MTRPSSPHDVVSVAVQGLKPERGGSRVVTWWRCCMRELGVVSKIFWLSFPQKVRVLGGHLKRNAIVIQAKYKIVKLTLNFIYCFLGMMLD